MKANAKGAAKVGVTEMTKKTSKYSPTNENIIFWDLPAIGTPTYPNLEEYCKKVGGLEKYDAFLIFCKRRFTQYDKELAEKVSSEINKPFFFVRTYVDYDLRNAKEDEGSQYNEDFVLEEMKKSCMENLGDLIKDKKNIFLIDNKAPGKFDFQRFKESITEALPHEKREPFVDSLVKVTPVIIRIKANLLRGMLFMKFCLVMLEIALLAIIVKDTENICFR